MDAKPHTLSPSSSDDCTRSPEFEFWMLRNPSFPQPHILSADQLFLHGVLLPLHLLPAHPETRTSQPHLPDPDPEPEPSPAITDSASATTLSASKRWKDIFRKKNAETSTQDQNEKDKLEKSNKKKKKERKASGSAASAADLNIINIWPFSRSRSAGNAATRPKLFPGAPMTRKSNSAPCSRSNSAGESKSRKWPSSPGRASGIHLGRSSPVWQARRGGSSSNKNPDPPPPLNPEKWSTSRRSKAASAVAAAGGGSAKASRVLNLNVPTCIGYRTNLGCRSDVMNSSNSNSNSNRNRNCNGGDGSSNGVGGNKLFTLRSLFTKKTFLTSH